MSFFSVIIPLFNKEQHIRDTVHSVLQQTFEDFELIIINDGSTDQSLEIAKTIKDDRIKIYVQKNSGVSKARNFGIEKAVSAHIALLDADDTWQTNHLEEHWKSIKKFPDAGLYCNAYTLKLTEKASYKATYSFSENKNIRLLHDYFSASMIHPIAMTNTVVFKKENFITLNKFNINLSRSEDIDLWIRFALNYKVVFNPTVTCSYNKTIANSLSKKNENQSEYQLFNAFHKEEKNNPSLKKYLDLNRYSLAIRCKISKDYPLLKKIKKEIDSNSLNSKQQFLLHAPAFTIRTLKKIHLFLIEKEIYLSSYQ